MPDLHYLTAHEARDLLDKRQVSSDELYRRSMERVHAVESKVRAYVTLTEDVGLRQATHADERIAQGKAGPLTGVPMQLKDVIATRNVRTTCGSRMLEDYVPVESATVAHKLYDAGATLLGKGNMDEFAMGSSTENSAFHPTSNPWDLTRVPGGSSGGGAAAVAAGEAYYALGSDTGGSIRQPAALCGIVGMKPTYGLVSRYGLVAFASSLDQIGPMTRDVRDCALVLETIVGHDPKDSTSLPRETPHYLDALTGSVRGLRVGVPKEYFAAGMEPGVKKAVDDAIKVYEGLGAKIDECSLPSTDYALAVYYIIAPSECSANLARYDGVKFGLGVQAETMWESMEQSRRQGFGPEVQRRIMVGTYALSAGYYDAYYKKAQQVRTLIRREFDEAFKRFDVLLTPTSPTVAFNLGERTADPVQMYLSDVCTIPVNIAGLPGISIPCGFSEGMPVGLQIIGPHFSEAAILRAAHAYEQATGWHKQHPAL